MEDLLEDFPCGIIFSRYIRSIERLPGFKRSVSCGRIRSLWLIIKDKLCEVKEPITLSELASIVNDYRLMEFILYALSREGYLYLRYTAGFTRKEMPKPRKAWSHIQVVHDRQSMAERLLFYLYTTGDKKLRRKRVKAFYNYIVVGIKWRWYNTFCANQNQPY